MSNNKYINEDTYQTLQEVSIETQSDYEKAIEPLWKEQQDEFKNFEVFVATPVHSDVSIHFTQALIEFQKDCFYKKLKVSFHLVKSSLVTQGRNLSVAGFLESKATHLLFIDSDIYFQGKSIFTMLKADKHIISVPYPLKTLMWDKAFKKMQEGRIKTPDDIRKALHTYPMKVPNPNDIKLDKGIMEVTDSPTGCMLIKREVIEKMIEKYPDKEIVQKQSLMVSMLINLICGIFLTHYMIPKKKHITGKILLSVNFGEILVVNVMPMLMMLLFMLENINIKASSTMS